MNNKNEVDSSSINTVDLSSMTEEEIIKGFRNGTIKPENNGKYWTTDDQNQLVLLYRNGVSLSKIAIEFGRNERAVSQQLDALDEVTTEADARCSRPKQPKCKCDNCKIYTCPRNPRYAPSQALENPDNPKEADPAFCSDR